MSFLIYCLWMISLLVVTGELDRIARERFPNQLQWQWLHTLPWYIAPFISMLLPGSGQFMNRQPIKGTLLLLWPILSGFGFFPRPWQLLQFNFLLMSIPWYLLAFADALVVAVISYYLRRRGERRVEAREYAESAAQVQSMSDFLERRKQSPGA